MIVGERQELLDNPTECSIVEYDSTAVQHNVKAPCRYSKGLASDLSSPSLHLQDIHIQGQPRVGKNADPGMTEVGAQWKPSVA